MPDPQRMSVPALAALDPRTYTTEVKARLGNDIAWAVLLDPVLVERTRRSLASLVASIEDQKLRATDEGDADLRWWKSVNRLQGLAQGRLATLTPRNTDRTTASSREARAWRGFAARLAQVLAEADPEALTRLQTPYGGLTAAEWLNARDEKQERS